MFEKWNVELTKKLKTEETTKGDIFNRNSIATLDENKHSMLVEDSVSALIEVQKELEDLERADLYDFFEIERIYGRTDKTR